MTFYIQIFLLLFYACTLGSCSLGSEPWEEWNNSEATQTQTGEIVEEQTKLTWSEEMVRNKIETIRKRLALKWLIIDWDAYYREWQLPLALKKYQDFYEQNNNDNLIKKKIADTYFEMKKFLSALNYYKKMEEIDVATRTNMNQALWYTSDIKTQLGRSMLSSQSSELHWESEIWIYNTISLACIVDFHNCKLQLDEYFWPKNIETTEDSQYELIWEEGEKKETLIEYIPLKNLKTAIENYRNFQLDDVLLKNAYIVWAYFWDEMYNLAIILWEKILEERPGYKPIIKIIAQSYFELWDYENVRKVLGQYYEIDDKDPAVSYMLWVVNTKLGELVLSNIYFSKALSLWYTPSTNVYRQLVHNYYSLDNEEKIRNTFKDMIKFEENLEAIDLSLGIYYHILWEDLITAQKWSKMWQEIFPDSTDFYGYEGWIHRENWKLDLAEAVLETGLELDSKNPFVIINLAYTKNEAWQIGAALIYFKRIIKDFPTTEFALMAQTEIDTLSQK